MALARSIPQPVEVRIPQEPIETTEVLASDGVPLDIGRYFEIDLFKMEEKEKNKLREIYKWAEDEVEEKTLGNILIKIRDLEAKMGMSRMGSERYNRLWNWVKMDKISKEIKKRQEALFNKVTLQEV